MKKDFYHFVSWLEFKQDKLTNRFIIYDYFDKLMNILFLNNIRIVNDNFKQQFIAYLYEHSKYSKIKKGIDGIGSDPPPELFSYKYEPIFQDFFHSIKEDTTRNVFNILDSNEKYQLINFIDLMERNIEITDDINDEDEEASEDSDYDNYY